MKGWKLKFQGVGQGFRDSAPGDLFHVVQQAVRASRAPVRRVHTARESAQSLSSSCGSSQKPGSGGES